jgi:transcriptional regulator with XRE-family HTH domain
VKEFDVRACPTCGGDGRTRLVNPDWLRMKRNGAGLTLRDVAKRLHISAVYVCDIELGRRAVPARLHDLYRTFTAKEADRG